VKDQRTKEQSSRESWKMNRESSLKWRGVTTAVTTSTSLAAFGQ
jgi:hypothetical protein